MGIKEKRAEADDLRAQIAARREEVSAATSAANEAVMEKRLDVEIDRLKAELAAFDAVPAPTEELSAPENPGDVVAPDLVLTDDVKKGELNKQAKDLGIQHPEKMGHDELVAAIQDKIANPEGNN